MEIGIKVNLSFYPFLLNIYLVISFIIKIDRRCDHHNLLGCIKGLISHIFMTDYDRCDYCKLLGCLLKIISQEFDALNGECDYYGAISFL